MADDTVIYSNATHRNGRKYGLCGTSSRRARAERRRPKES